MARSETRGRFLQKSHGGAQAFDRWVEALASLPPGTQTGVLTWPLATAFGFLAQPHRHFFLKPNVRPRDVQSFLWVLASEEYD